MMKIINAFPGVGEPMTEEEAKNCMAKNDNSLLIRIGLMDEKGEPIIIPQHITLMMSLIKYTLTDSSVLKR